MWTLQYVPCPFLELSDRPPPIRAENHTMLNSAITWPQGITFPTGRLLSSHSFHFAIRSRRRLTGLHTALSGFWGPGTIDLPAGLRSTWCCRPSPHSFSLLRDNNKLALVIVLIQHAGRVAGTGIPGSLDMAHTVSAPKASDSHGLRLPPNSRTTSLDSLHPTALPTVDHRHPTTALTCAQESHDPPRTGSHGSHVRVPMGLVPQRDCLSPLSG
jgi:hypothetical protein